ncbi:MAG: ATP-binding protein [Betaproteobacteria bacterium]|nr:ATP-binding protein [Betaproteobacteria bacterium]
MSLEYTIPRRAENLLLAELADTAAVILTGARQTGKSALARKVAATRASVIYDLENTDNYRALRDPGAELRRHSGKLVVIDEVQKRPELFSQLRVIIDEERSAGNSAGKFLLLGSVTGKLQGQSEGLTGRAARMQLHPFDWLEVRGHTDLPSLWNRGGHPRSLLAATDELSSKRRQDYLDLTLYADVLSTSTRVRATLADYKNLLLLLADRQKDIANKARLASDLGLPLTTVNAMLANLEELMIVRRLPAYAVKVSPRVAKNPKYYICDSGLLHTVMGKSAADLASRSRGASWEGFVIQNLIAVLPRGWEAYFFKIHGNGHEIDLLLQIPGGGLWAVEIKAGASAMPDRRFTKPLKILAPERSFIVTYGEAAPRNIGNIEILSLADMMNELLAQTVPLHKPQADVMMLSAASNAFTRIMQALNDNDEKRINIRRPQFIKHFSRLIDTIFQEQNAALWQKQRNELICWLAAEAARTPELPEADTWLAALIRVLEKILAIQSQESGSSFSKACCHDLFVQVLATLIDKRCFGAVCRLATSKYYLDGKMLESARFSLRPIDRDSIIAESLASFNPPDSVAALIDAELILMLHDNLPRKTTSKNSGLHWRPAILLAQPGTPPAPFFVRAQEPAGATALLACFGLPPDTAGVRTLQTAGAEILKRAQLSDSQNAVDWQRIERCLNINSWNDLQQA